MIECWYNHCLFAILTLLNYTTCRKISLITLKVDMEILSIDYDNYHVVFWKPSLYFYLKIWMLSLRAWLMKQLRTWNVVSVEALCEVTVERLTQELCSQGWHVLVLLEPRFWSPRPSFREEEGNWSADRVYRWQNKLQTEWRT